MSIKNIKDMLIIRCRILEELIEKINAEIPNLPQGRVNIKHHNNFNYYYAVGSDYKEKLIKNGEQDFLRKLLKRNYYEKILKSAKYELKILKQTLVQYPEMIPENVYLTLSEDRKPFVDPIFLTDEHFVERWMSVPYTRKPMNKDTPFFETLKGDRVRSKSEMIIADRLYASNIPYKYECPLTVGKKIIHPDFTILKLSERKIVYYEHCGKIGDEVYADDMVQRINDYAQEGILLGDNLFITCETKTKPLDVRVVDEMIEKLFR